MKEQKSKKDKIQRKIIKAAGCCVIGMFASLVTALILIGIMSMTRDSLSLEIFHNFQTAVGISFYALIGFAWPAMILIVVDSFAKREE